MTLPEFYEALEALDVEWSLTETDAIRTKDNFCCPIIAVVNKKLDCGAYVPRNSYAFTYGRHTLGLSNEDIAIIVTGADSTAYESKGYACRVELLKRTVSKP